VFRRPFGRRDGIRRLPRLDPSPRSAFWPFSLFGPEAEAAIGRYTRPKGKFERDRERPLEISEQFLIVLTCRDEKHQVELLERFEGEGLEVKALVG
jgi:hypothetical protein